MRFLNENKSDIRSSLLSSAIKNREIPLDDIREAISSGAYEDDYFARLDTEEQHKFFQRIVDDFHDIGYSFRAGELIELLETLYENNVNPSADYFRENVDKIESFKGYDLYDEFKRIADELSSKIIDGVEKGTVYIYKDNKINDYLDVDGDGIDDEEYSLLGEI